MYDVVAKHDRDGCDCSRIASIDRERGASHAYRHTARYARKNVANVDDFYCHKNYACIHSQLVHTTHAVRSSLTHRTRHDPIRSDRLCRRTPRGSAKPRAGALALGATLGHTARYAIAVTSGSAFREALVHSRPGPMQWLTGTTVRPRRTRAALTGRHSASSRTQHATRATPRKTGDGRRTATCETTEE